MSVLPPKPRDHRAKAPSRVQVAEEMFQTLQEMTTQVAFTTSRQASLEALGPFAALFEEFMARQAALEDFVGFTYVPKAKSDAPPAPEPAVAQPADASAIPLAASDAPHLGGEGSA